MPEQIRFLFENTTGMIQGLIVFFIFRSKIKNSFTIGPLVTGKNGDIVLTKQSVKKAISLNKSEFPMDYGGELADCDLLSVLVETRSELEDRVARLKEFYPDDALALQKNLENAANDESGLCKAIEMPIENEEIFLSPRRAR